MTEGLKNMAKKERLKELGLSNLDRAEGRILGKTYSFLPLRITNRMRRKDTRPFLVLIPTKDFWSL